ncbi:MAG: hypothetical protein OEZ06_16385 [Myxococcales bacterium]|nr:hypothetical protein [Myxococcales bacterium]
MMGSTADNSVSKGSIDRRQRRHLTVKVILAALSLLFAGCLERDLKELNPCLVSGVSAQVAITNIDKIDLLFVVDNSSSMREEQLSLSVQIPKLVRVLTTGDRDGDGVSDFPAAKDLHLGVVSSDMGLVGIKGIGGCDGFGGDGIMNTRPGPEATECQANYPRFIAYAAGVNEPDQTVKDFACIAALGTDGCGFEQQLEAGFKALWPSIDIDPMTGQPFPENRFEFLSDENGFGKLGHGDQENAGFLRNDPVEGISLIAVIVVTDEEDCSSHDTRHFSPDDLLPKDDPLRDQDLNVRCYHNKHNLYDVDRYVSGLQALRPSRQDLVLFGVIAGVPTDLVSPEALAEVDFKDEGARENHYATILADPRMQEVVVASTDPTVGDNLAPSCKSESGRAFPPRRLVEVARRFRDSGIVQSICEDDFGPAMDAIINLIADRLGNVCLPRPLVRNSNGLVDCKVVWELPPPHLAQAGTPTACRQSGWEFLQLPDTGRATVAEHGGAVCQVSQLAVTDGTRQLTGGFAEGWYYDDFSETLGSDCKPEQPQRVAFTNLAKPPTGVTVKLECLNEAQTLSEQRKDVMMGVEQPDLGDACDQRILNSVELRGDAACGIRLTSGQVDGSMFCHPEANVCVKACATDADCPAAWVCDDRDTTRMATSGDTRPNGSPICVNPTCGG